MLPQYIEGKVEHNVRVRLANLKEVKNVSAIHAAFRAIMVEAVQHLISGPDACSAFRNGLKPAVYQLLMTDPIARDKCEHLDAVVKAAKETEYLPLNLSSSAGDDTPRQDDHSGYRQDHKRRSAPLKNKEAKKPGKHVPYDVAFEEAKWIKKGLPERVFDRRHVDDRCYNCGIRGHNHLRCPNTEVVMPRLKPAK